MPPGSLRPPAKARLDSAYGPASDPARLRAQAELMASFGRLRQRFRDVAGVVEGLGALRTLGGEEALIEVALFAQSHEQTVERAMRALGECEALARAALSQLASNQPQPPSEPAPESLVSPLTTEPAPPVSLGQPESVRGVEEEGPVTEVDLSAPRVLVVDDDPAVLRAFRRVLSSKYRIVTARDGAEALKLVLTGERVDAIICDIGMPKLDGPAFFSELFELCPQLIRRVVFCTGGAPNEKTQRYLDKMQAPLLLKPVTSGDLLSAIATVRAR